MGWDLGLITSFYKKGLFKEEESSPYKVWPLNINMIFMRGGGIFIYLSKEVKSYLYWIDSKLLVSE